MVHAPASRSMGREAAKPPQVMLRDETTVLVRPVEPGDKDLIRAGFDRLSDESRYRRFLTPTSELGQPMLRYLTEVDHHDHEALVAVDQNELDYRTVSDAVEAGRIAAGSDVIDALRTRDAGPAART
jgi:hypothetical protein